MYYKSIQHLCFKYIRQIAPLFPQCLISNTIYGKNVRHLYTLNAGIPHYDRTIKMQCLTEAISIPRQIQAQLAITLLPPSSVILLRTCILKYPVPNLFISPASTLTIALGANTNASPTLRRTISLKISLAFLPASEPPATSSCASAARCDRRHCSQSGNEKRCTMVMEHRSRREGEMVGS